MSFVYKGEILKKIAIFLPGCRDDQYFLQSGISNMKGVVCVMIAMLFECWIYSLRLLSVEK